MLGCPPTIKDLTLQRAALTGAGCKRLYEEKASGAKRSRQELTRMQDQLRAGEVLTKYSEEGRGFFCDGFQVVMEVMI